MSRILTVLVITCFCVASSHILLAKTYYVSTSGTDRPEAISQPGPNQNACRTIQYVINSADLGAGDVVIIQGGTYVGNIQLGRRDSGSSDGFVVFKNYQNDNVKISSTNSGYPLQFYDSGGWVEYIKWDGSGLDGGQHIRITTTSSNRCVMIRQARHIWLTNLQIDSAQHNECVKLTSKNQEFAGDDNSGSRDCIIEYSKILNGGDYGIKLTGYGTQGNIIRYNQIFQNGGRGSNNYGMNISGSGYEENIPRDNVIYKNDFYDNFSTGLQLTVTSGNIISENRFYGNGTGTRGNGFSFGSGSFQNEASYNEVRDNSKYGIECYAADENRIFYNVVFRNSLGQLRIQNQSDHNEVLNNTFHGPRESVYLGAGTVGTILRNNIGVSTGAEPALHNGGSGRATCDHNLLLREGSRLCVYWDGDWKTIDEWFQDTGQGGNSLSEDPLFVAVSDDDFRLQASSPCIGAGMDVGLPFPGPTPDLGGILEAIVSSPPQAPTNLRVLSE